MALTGRSLEYLRARGWFADIGERWLPNTNRRRDLFGFGDVIAFHHRERLFLIAQVTSLGHVADRVKKVRQAPAAYAWLKTGGRIEVHGWYQDEAGSWHVRIIEIDNIEPLPLAPFKRKRRRRQPTMFGSDFDGN